MMVLPRDLMLDGLWLSAFVRKITAG